MADADDQWKRLEERFRAESDAFLPSFRQDNDDLVLRTPDDVRKLAEFADRWKVDPRPWARRMVLEYLELPFDRGGHHAVVRRLFKHFEGTGHLAVMGAFLAAFDRSIRRKRLPPGPRGIVLTVVPETIPAKAWLRYDRRGVKRLRFRNHGTGKLYTAATRQYFRRRAWRWFRGLGRTDGAAYLKAAAEALLRYRDADLPSGESLLDRRGLTHLLFGKHPLLAIDPRHIRVRPGHSLTELTPRPFFPEHWETPAGGELLERLTAEGGAGIVRRWTETLLSERHSERLARWGTVEFLRCFAHPDERTQRFVLTVLERFPPEWPADRWLGLLHAVPAGIAEDFCKFARKRIPKGEVSWDQALELACLPQAPVVRLAKELLARQRQLSAEQLRELPRLARLRCLSEATDLTEWALDRLAAAGTDDPDLYCAFLDGMNYEVRKAAAIWWDRHPDVETPVWYLRLLESPYTDVRLHLVQRLDTQRQLVEDRPDAVKTLWLTVLLDSARGSRQKPKVLAQIADCLRDHPERGADLLPAVVVAVRSVRSSESRAGLAVLVEACLRDEKIAAWTAAHVPELAIDANPSAEGALS